MALDLGGGESEAAEAQVVPALEAVGGAAEVEDGQLDGGGLLVFEAAEAGAAGGALDEEAGAGGEELGRAGVRVAGEDEGVTPENASPSVGSWVTTRSGRLPEARSFSA